VVGGNNSAFRRALRSAALLLCLATLLLLAFPGASRAQAFKLQGGTSSLYHGHGGSVEMRGLNYTAQLSFGWLDGPRTGFSYATLYRGALVNLGDQAIPFGLPTDIFNASYHFLGRGASMSWKRPGRALYVYGGATSQSYFLPFFKAANAETGAGLVMFEQQFSPKLRFFSRNVISKQQTSIQSLEWRGSDRFKLAASGGIGSNQPYAATTLDRDRGWLAVPAGYTVAGDRFRRIRVEPPVMSETDRENVRIELRPTSNLSLVASRFNYLSPEENSNRMLRATVNGFSAFTNLGGLQLHGSLYDSQNDSGRARALTLGARRNFFNRVDVAADFLRGRSAGGTGNSSLVTTFREKITPRFSLSQVVTTGGGQKTVAFGGSYNGNRISASAEYQTIYVPFATGADSPFKQVLVLNLRLMLPGFVELNLASDVTPLGEVRYTSYATAFAYRGAGMGGSSSGSGSSGGAVHPYLMHGRVADVSGEPVRGAAIFVDNEVVFTDSRGYFSLRRKKAGEYPLAVALKEFMLPGRYEVVSAPERVKAERDKDADEIRIVLRRLPNIPLPETVDPSQLGAPKPPAPVAGAALANLPVLELSRRDSMSFRDFSMALLPPMRYNDGVSAEAVPPSPSKAANDVCPQPVGTVWYWPANSDRPVAEQPVGVRYVQLGADAERAGAGDAHRPSAGNGQGDGNDLPGARRPCSQPGGKRTEGSGNPPAR